VNEISIHAVSQAVRAEFSRRLFPHAVVYGPERTKPDVFRARVVFERDRSKGDAIVPPPTGRGAQVDPDVPYCRRVRGVATVYAVSPASGAGAHDHEAACDRACDGVLTALYRVCKGFMLEISESRLMRSDEWNDVETWTGCAAVIRFSVLARVRETDYVGRGPDTAVIADVNLVVVESPIRRRPYPYPNRKAFLDGGRTV
jgi:hypothetical protein